MTLFLFLHLLGVALWIGGGWAVKAIGRSSPVEARSQLRYVVKVQWAVTRAVMFPGVLLTVLSGLFLTFRLMGAVGAGSGGLMAMQGLGLLGALLSLFISIPAYARLSRIDPEGDNAAYFDRLLQRAQISGAVAGVLALAALVGGAVHRYGG